MNSVFEAKNLLFPVNCGNVHWTLLVVNMECFQMTYYDSVGGVDSELFDMMEKYIQHEAEDKLKPSEAQHWSTRTWTRVNPEPGGGECALQENGCDCGVFLIMWVYVIITTIL